MIAIIDRIVSQTQLAYPPATPSSGVIIARSFGTAAARENRSPKPL